MGDYFIYIGKWEELMLSGNGFLSILRADQVPVPLTRAFNLYNLKLRLKILFLHFFLGGRISYILGNGRNSC